MSQGSSSNQHRTEEVLPSVDSSASVEREELLRNVIETTFSGASQDLSELEWESLRQVVQRHPSATKLDLAVVCDLVRALIETRFVSLKQDEALLQRLSLRIAGTLWSHPVSNSRLRRFWELLLGQV